MEDKILPEENVVVRHSAIEIAEHWIIAVSGLVLLFSGFGEFPMYKRYMITLLPGLSWAGDFWIHLKIHYLAAIVFVSASLFHVVYHGMLGDRGLLPRKGDGRASLKTILSFVGIGHEPKSDKYLPEQRLAYAFIAIVSFILIVTGLIKVAKNLPFIYMPPIITSWATLIHTFATFLFLFAFISHIGALIIKVNRPLVKAIFTGKVDLEYVRHRHTIWYEQLVKKLPPEESSIDIVGEDTLPDRAPEENHIEAACSEERVETEPAEKVSNDSENLQKEKKSTV